ncbi:GNAT family protein [Prolixibacteraceae bacterium Z1-6]|uniref:GNAT family protein n=1 Tax=Draconibacterium aestuarii TaxID=2998507 RepID=A0A9X3J4T6_9BACT|nr:GNAT family protein [Prolixibacteraceae bacterium Z1-6]
MNFTTTRLILRPFCIADKEALFEYRSDTEANKYQGWIPQTINDAETFISKLSAQANIPGTWFQLALIEKESQKLIGDVGIHFIDEDNLQVELGFTMHAQHQQKGYATEAVKSIIGYLFTDLNKHRITASVDPENTSSIRLLERLGFRKEAHFKESLLIDERWVDDVIYALLKREWGEQKEA